MKTDFKLWYIMRDPTGSIVEAAVRFYEGELEEIGEETVYVRTERLQKESLTHLGDFKTKKEANGNEAVVYTKEDFGKIKTEEELISFLKTEIAKDVSREVINELKLN